MTSTSDPRNVPKIEDAPNEPIFYSNIAALRATPEEIIIHFGLREDDPNLGIGVGKAILSAPHAKRLAIALSRVIENYELNFGEIIADIEQRLTPDARDLVRKLNEESREKAAQNH